MFSNLGLIHYILNDWNTQLAVEGLKPEDDLLQIGSLECKGSQRTGTEAWRGDGSEA